MNIRNICLLSILGMFLSFTFTGKPSDAQAHKFRIYVSVDHENENTEALMSSWIKRELRSLGDVRIVSFDAAAYIFSVVAIEGATVTGRKTGSIAMAIAFYMRSSTNPDLYYRPNLWVQTGGIENLERLCKRIVAGIDANRLEPIRELFQ